MTDQNPHQIVTGLVRSKLLDLLPNEMPYETVFSIRFWEVDNSGECIMNSLFSLINLNILF